MPTLAGIAPDKEQCVQSLEEKEGRLKSEGEGFRRLTVVDKDREAARHSKAGGCSGGSGAEGCVIVRERELG